MATRRERVVLELEDQFTTGMARAAASAALLNRELDSLSKESVRTRRSVSDIDQPMQNLGRSSGNVGREVDKVSGRLRILADVTAILGPGLVGIGAVGVPAIAGLAAQMGFAVTAAGTAVLAFQGVGDTLKALNTAALRPTQENLEKAQVALEGLSPAAQGFVVELGNMLPELRKLRDVAAEGLFPGLTVGLDAMENALPHVQGLLASVSNELGNIAGDTGVSLASERWTPFLDFLAREAPTALGQMADAAGNAGHAVAELWMATNPINNSFGQWLVDATDDLDKWAEGLSKTQGFADFMAYLDKTGPKVAEAIGSIANAALQIVQAAAPLSGPVLEGVTALANLVSTIANSDIGTPLFTAVAALALFNRTMAITRTAGNTAFAGFISGQLKASRGLRTVITDLNTLRRESAIVTAPGKGFIGPLSQAQTAVTRLRDPKTGLAATLTSVGKSAAVLGGVGIAATGAADGIGLTNTASLALAGTIAGPWGTAVGAGVGLLLDAKDASQGFADSMSRADAAIKGFDTSAIQASIADLKRQRADLTTTSGVGDFFSDSLKEIRGAGAFKNDTIDNLDGKLKSLQGRLDMTKAAASQDILQQGFRATATGIDSATQSAREFQGQLQKANDILTGRADHRAFEQSLLDFEARGKKRLELKGEIATKKGDLASAQADLVGAKTPAAQQAAQNRIDAARQSIKALRTELDLYTNTLDTSTQAGIDTEAALDNIAATALKQSQDLAGSSKVIFLAAAHDMYAKAAQDAGLSFEAAKARADEVFGPKGIIGKFKIVVDANGVYHVIDLVAARLERLTRKTYKLNIQAQAVKNRDKDGDPSTPYYTGGYTGAGGKYEPKGVVHGGEFVFSKEATSGNVAYLETLHRQMRGYADGGLVRGWSTPAPVQFATASQGGPFIDYERLAKAMAAVRPMYGDAHFYGDAAKREQDRLSGLDGRRRR